MLSILCHTASANSANSLLLTKFTSLSDTKYTTHLGSIIFFHVPKKGKDIYI